MMDPYVTLGVSNSASLEDIKAAYKKLAKKYHPDLNPGNKEAETKFKDIVHAYDLVGTEEARSKFDNNETDAQKQQMYEDYMRGQGQKREGPYYHHTQDQSGRYSSAYEDINDDIFTELFGKARGAGGLNIRGQDESYQLEIDFLEAALGTEKIITLPSGKKLQVKIPGGIQAGQKLKFKGLGGKGIGKAQSGDAYVEIGVRESDRFKREGKDILSEIPISLFEAVNGGEVKAQTIDGPVMIKIPPGVSSGGKLRIKNKGAGTPDNRGAHIVSLKVVIPKILPDEFKQALKELESRYSYDPREV